MIKFKTLEGMGIVLFFFVTVSIAHAEVFTGTLEPEDPTATTSYFSATIPFTLSEDSRLSFDASVNMCEQDGQFEVGLFIAGAPFTGNGLITSAGHTHPIPVKAGEYEISVACDDRQSVDGPPIEYRIEPLKESLYDTMFQEDPEPDSEEVITISQTTAFEGWTDVLGYSELYSDSNQYGSDGWDEYYLNMRKGTKLKVKLEWDIRDPSIYNRCYVLINGWEDGETVLPNIPPSNTTIAYSGDVTPEYTLQNESGSYRMNVHCVETGDNDVMGYKVTLIITDGGGEEPPTPPETGELKMNIDSATWHRMQEWDRAGNKNVYYELRVEYLVENTMNQAQTVAPALRWFAPLLAESTSGSIIDTADLLDVINSSVRICDHMDVYWNRFCENSSIGYSSCRFLADGWNIDSFVVPVNSKVKKSFRTIISEELYADFAEGFQYFEFRTPGVTFYNNEDPDACYVHGTYFWPTVNIVPFLNNLLLK